MDEIGLVLPRGEREYECTNGKLERLKISTDKDTQTTLFCFSAGYKPSSIVYADKQWGGSVETMVASILAGHEGLVPSNGVLTIPLRLEASLTNANGIPRFGSSPSENWPKK